MKIKYLPTMKRTLLIMLMTGISISIFAQHLRVNTLCCDYRTNPAGVEARPRLSWQLQSDQRNTLQTAYRILVADNPATLAHNEGNIWDSKNTATDSSIQIAYNGPALQPAATYYWKVMVWDNHRNASAWSATVQWQTALA